MFGRRKKGKEAEDGTPDVFEDAETDAADDGTEYDDFDAVTEVDGGPYDADDLESGADLTVGEVGTRLDLGSVLVPMPQGAQLQVEMAPDGSPQAVHLVTQHGRVTVAAYAAPKSPGQWREVAGDLAESLRNDNATVSVESGPWGREVFAVTPNADLRFIGVDGYRWMVRCVVAGPSGGNTSDSELVATARAILRDTVVKRGNEPNPVRTPLPVVLPEALAQQLAAAHQQQLAQQQGAAPQQPAAPQPGPVPQDEAQAPQAPVQPQQRRGESGSAMQQLGR
ncbi:MULTISPECIES: DUF3710 domain-containing protein [unclassified Rhodococcus (in: high G+C Gram-positive bacteria)]|uniref:DUF3710 domain-containing protein n=1 Tax=unclassified Rhodococcus (in: high G+C Gram-positive bacteria) TaxID=192944 RepID=UPI00163B09F3|nr:MULTISPECIES: DUF3710 domain-containing protein [unclassified Rhodococcus (in: high G+C Gram-positive bacteria)]MBC2643935.1 DUF3710 domain-containing protein [Rhodococcus sp. 3A]MBC2891326.1 DUF3710 domain-containing protein [Rhodococcus sp. 4CII]